MDIHLIIKFQYHAWNLEDKSIKTIPAHEEILAKHGKVYWGRVSSISQSKIDIINNQIAEGKKTYVFLYATDVPKAVHSDENLWYIAEIENAYPGSPVEKKLIPEYYRENSELEVAFLLSSIKPIIFETGLTPKVPGQAAIRYCALKGSPNPKNLYSYSDPNQRITKQRNETPEVILSAIESSYSKKQVTLVADTALKDELLNAKSEIIDLQNEILNLREYKELYRKILDTDYLFSSEKFLESWLQENIHRILPELEIIDRQPTISWPDGQFGRLDLLAKNKETNDIAIIEVKTRKRRLKSGYDQFLRYTTWVRRFKNEIQDKYKLNKNTISDYPNFIIITDYTTQEMEAICKDHGITLIKVFGGLGFEKVA